MKSKQCSTYYTAKEAAKDAIDAGYTDVQILLGSGRLGMCFTVITLNLMMFIEEV